MKKKWKRKCDLKKWYFLTLVVWSWSCLVRRNDSGQMTTCIVTPEIIQLLLQPFQENPKKSIIVLRYGELEQLDHQSKFYDDHDHFSLRVSSHIDCMFCSKHLHAKQKKSPQGFQHKINEGGTLQPNQWHFRELRHLPNHHVSVAEWTPTHARTSALKQPPTP